MEICFKGKTALITGSGKRSGIGGCLARRFAACGAEVILADLGNPSPDMEKPVNYEYGCVNQMLSIADEIKGEFGVDAVAVEMDVSRTESVVSAVEKIRSRFGKLDVLVNNAGVMVGLPSPLHEYSESSWMKTIDVNLNGVYRVSKAAVPLMSAGTGAIINIASRAGKTPPPMNAAYAASKAGVIMLTKVMAHELSSKKIRVNAICPGLIQTDIQKPNIAVKAKMFGTSLAEAERRMVSSVPLKRFGTPDDVADLCLFLASEFSSYITGQAINVCGGLLMEV
jgi:NAD(P)-dependent dehydrogenase (short-subunit alcohol dehydrogenase family)